MCISCRWRSAAGQARWLLWLALISPPALALDYAQALARVAEQQPQLQALGAEARAAEQRALAAGELPDPMLSFGISEIPINTEERFSLRRDGDTDVMLSLRQEFPRAEKRRLAREREQRLAQGLGAEQAAQLRALQREAGLAWLSLWWTDAAEPLLREDLEQARLLQETLAIAYVRNAASQATLLAAEVAVAAREEDLDALLQARDIARTQLRRWIGTAAEAPTRGEPPALSDTDLDSRLAALERHPHVLAEASRLAIAETDVALARQDYRPDWALSVGFGYRPAFSEMGTVMVEMPLPLFTARRQDARLAAAEAGRLAEEARIDDLLREHRAHVREHAEVLRRLQSRLQRYDAVLLPTAEAQVEAALADYAAGRAELPPVLDARRQRLALRLQALDLRRDAAERVIQLDYFAPSAPESHS
jgi:outer membrane protein, heavy metal efflux system